MLHDGLLIIDKPAGITSAEVVRAVKQHLRCKTGHLGTLDPFATGVLPLCLGEGTKIAQFLNDADKEYVGLIRLGRETDTGDLTGRVTATAPLPALTAAEIAGMAERFCGSVQQVPPMYSAIKRAGTPLYKLARQGLVVERAARPVEIRSLALSLQDDANIAFTVVCSKGTYVRVLAQEIAAALGSLGYLEALRRTRFGQFGLAQAIPLAALATQPPHVIGLREALGHLPEICVDAAAAARARQGYEPLLGAMRWPAHTDTVKVVDPGGRLAAVVVTDPSGRRRFGRVFAGAGDEAL